MAVILQILSCISVIFCKTVDTYYVGETNDTKKRLELHNTGYFSGSYTTRATDWAIVLAILCDSISHAKKLENFIKRMKSRKFIERLLEDPQLVADIVQKTKTG